MFYNRIFLDPAIKGTYEEGFFELLEHHGILMDYTQEDLQLIKENTMDWVGINLYHPNRVKGRIHAIRKEAPFHPCYYYEEFDGITDFLIESYKDMDVETAKTRFYFKGKKLQFIKTIYQTVDPDTGEIANIEELLKANIEYQVEENIFEIPSEYAES